MKTKIKLCGLRDKESILASSDADYIGFVFYQKTHFWTIAWVCDFSLRKPYEHLTQTLRTWTQKQN